MATLLALFAVGAAACGDDDESNARSFQDKARALSPAPAAPADDQTKKPSGSGSSATPAEAAPPQKVEGGDENDRSIEISSSDFPEGTWPLTIERGELRCVDTKTSRTIIFRANGQDYPVNGVPEGGRIIGIEPIWKEKDDPQAPGTRMDITPLFKKGYELCGD